MLNFYSIVRRLNITPCVLCVYLYIPQKQYNLINNTNLGNCFWCHFSINKSFQSGVQNFCVSVCMCVNIYNNINFVQYVLKELKQKKIKRLFFFQDHLVFCQSLKVIFCALIFLKKTIFIVFFFTFFFFCIDYSAIIEMIVNRIVYIVHMY